MNTNIQQAIASAQAAQADFDGLQQSADTATARVATLEQQLAALKGAPQPAANSIPVIFQQPTFSSLEKRQGWKNNTDHDTSKMPHGPETWTLQADGWTRVAIKPAGKLGEWPSDNYYHDLDLGANAFLTRFAWQGSMMLPTQADYTACQAPEIEIEQCINGDAWDTCAWQAPLGGGKPFSRFWRYFNKPNGNWVDSAIPFDPAILAPGKPLALLAESHKPDPDHIQYDALTLNGRRYALDNVVVSVKRKTWGANVNYVHFSWQQDSVKNAPYSLLVRELTAWLM
jgi:hypothetical protein